MSDVIKRVDESFNDTHKKTRSLLTRCWGVSNPCETKWSNARAYRALAKPSLFHFEIFETFNNKAYYCKCKIYILIYRSIYVIIYVLF